VSFDDHRSARSCARLQQSRESVNAADPKCHS
jgi:hypothetical protein